MTKRRGLKGTSPQHAERARAHFAAAAEELAWASSPATREYGGRPKILAKAARHLTAGFANCEWVTATRAAKACDAEGRRLTRKLAELEGPERVLTHNLALDAWPTAQDGLRGPGKGQKMSRKTGYKAGAVSATDAVRQLKAAAAKCDMKWMRAHAASARFFGAREAEVKAAAKRCPSAKAGLIGVAGTPRQHAAQAKRELSAARKFIAKGDRASASARVYFALQECEWTSNPGNKTCESARALARDLDLRRGSSDGGGFGKARKRKRTRKAQKARR